MTYFHSLFLGIVQGITEFLPVSSSGHLVLAQKVFGLDQDMLTFDICVHFGTLIAVFTVFHKSIINLTVECFNGLKSIVIERTSIKDVYQNSYEIRISAAIIIGTLPAVIVGLTLKDFFEKAFQSAFFVFISLFLTGCLLLVTFFVKKNKKQIGFINGLIIGLAQSLAIIPGISRSGSTISTALLLGVRREDAGEFSFLLSIPAILGATVFAIKDISANGFSSFSWEMAVIGIISAFISGWISLVFLMRIIKHGKIGYFGFYCLTVAIGGIILYSL